MGYYEDLNNGKVGKHSDAHYISAYGIAVKHGFTGSEEEWLESLSDYGIAKKHGFTGSEEEWNEAVNAARDAAEAAKTAAEAAKTAAEAAKAGAYSDAEYVGNALTYILEIQSSIEGSKSTVVSARKEAVSARDDAKAAKVDAEAAKVDAEAARDEAEAVRSDVENIAGELSGYVKREEVFETAPFGWTDFGYTLPTNDGGASYVNENALNVGGTDQPIVVHCAGKTLGFTFSVSGWSNAHLSINGIATTYTNSASDGSEFATSIVIPQTYMESDIEFSGGMNVWTFTDMTIQSIKGVSELEAKLGDIDTALDGILSIENSLIGGGAV